MLASRDQLGAGCEAVAVALEMALHGFWDQVDLIFESREEL